MRRQVVLLNEMLFVLLLILEFARPVVTSLDGCAQIMRIRGQRRVHLLPQISAVVSGSDMRS